jgi:hypothetical protein
MGGPGTGGPGVGGPRKGGSQEMMGVSETLMINHEEPKLTVKVPMKFETKEQILEFQYTTDGKPNQNSFPGGITVKSKTRWEKNRHTTKSNSSGPMGSMEIIESRSLSDDGSTMSVEYTMKAGPMDWKRKLVYEKEKPAGPSK